MRRRHVLKLGAALATLPLTGCGTSPPPPKLGPSGTDAAAGDRALGGDKVPGGGPGTTATAGNDAAAATDAANGNGTDADAGKAAATDPANARGKEEPPGSAYSRVVAKVGKNHGHVLTVSFADVQAGAEKTYTFAGTSDHPHSVTLSADDMKSLLAGQIFRTKSSRDKQHAHRVLVRCAPAADPPEWVAVCEATFSGKDEHELVIPAADMSAKADRTYDVQGIAGHPHQLTVTAADFQKLAKGEAVSLKSTRDKDDAHLHVVFIQYRAPKP